MIDGRHVLHACQHLEHQPAKCRPHDDAAGDGEQERRGDGSQGERLRRRGSHGEAIDEERARVVQQALAFEDGEDAVRRPQLAKHRGRGRSVWRRHHRAEDDGRRPRHLWQQAADDDGHGSRRQAHRAHDQARDRRPVVAQVSQRRVECRIEEHRRDEDRQRQFRRHRERRHARHEGQERATQRQEDRVRRAEAARGTGEGHGREEQREQFFESPHVWPLRRVTVMV